jgi:hypothetical protein
MLPPYIVYISIATSLFCAYFYVRNIWQGKTKPNLASWFIWLLAPAIAGFILLEQGAGTAAIPVFMASTSPLLVMLSALLRKNAYWKLSTLDYVCLGLSMCALIAWLFLKQGVLATIFAILADGIAFIPTYVKSWKNPETETLSSYYSGSLNGLLNIFTTRALTFSSIGFALYLFLGNLVEIAIVLYKRNKSKNIAWQKEKANS